MTEREHMRSIRIGVLALQGAFNEHVQLLQQAIAVLKSEDGTRTEAWTCGEVRTPAELAACDALIIPGGESTTMALVAERSNLLEPLRKFVKVDRKPTWGTCAGLILLSEAANRTKKGGQELIGGLDVRVNRNHFGRQIESFETLIDLPFLRESSVNGSRQLFKGVFIRAPVVEKILPQMPGAQVDEEAAPEIIVAPSRSAKNAAAFAKASDQVDVLATLPGRARMTTQSPQSVDSEAGDIIAVRQRNVFATSFHPELTEDVRIHVWWLRLVRDSLDP